MDSKRTAALIAGLCLLPALVQGGDWPQFRGPNNSGVAADSQAPAEWSGAKNVAWKEAVPGYGWSSPVIVGDKLIVTTAVSDKQTRPKPFTYGGGPPGEKGGSKEGFKGPPGGFDGGKEGFKGPPGGFGKGKGGFKGPPGGFGKGMFGNAKPPDATYRWEIHCLDRHTGKKLWSQVALERKPTIAATMGNTYASETPVSDGERVYAYFGMHGLFCYDLAGNKLWSADLGSYPMMMSWGTGSSPAVDGGRVFVLCDNEEKSFLVALDAKTGKELWRTERDEKSNWTTPFVWRNKVRTEIVAAGGKAIRSYNPADGKLLWELKRESTAGGMPNSVNSTPVADESLLYAGAGAMRTFGPMWAVKAGAKGDIALKDGETSNEYIAWSSTKAGPTMPSPLLYDGCLYVHGQSGILVCLEAKTGKEIYRERLKGGRSFTSSPWTHRGNIYFLDEDGKALVVKAGPKFRQVGENMIEDMFWATPAVAQDALYLRGADRIYCVK